MLDWHSCQICYPLKIKILLLLLLLYTFIDILPRYKSAKYLSCWIRKDGITRK